MHQEVKSKCSVLSSLARYVAELTEKHEQKQVLWYPSEILPRDHIVPDLPPEAVATLVLNLLTEEGLPHFHRLLATHLGEESYWVSWTDLWTAEEDRHGAVLHNYLLRMQSVNMVAVEKMQYNYLRLGFRPDWQKDPYQLLAYTVLQERATQISHQNVGHAIKGVDPVLARILLNIAGEEAKHFAFYRAVFEKVLDLDANQAFQALHKVMYSFKMPGANIPGFEELAYVAERTKVFNAECYKTIIEETIEHFKLEQFCGLNKIGKKALDQIKKLPKLLDRKTEKLTKLEVRSINLPFLLQGAELTL